MEQKKHNIFILPENLANKIAAGEVVERPSSVVKELLENSIDAGANKIQVIISSGGKKLIQVIDDGSGIIENDLPLAFERHATSKIQSEADLDAILTLGFRGEALPSIASVSQIEIKTKDAASKMGLIYTIDGGNPDKIRKIAANTGTSISIRNLFFNTPARRKFLKSDAAENQQIMIVLKRFFLAYPEIEFHITIDDKQIFMLKPASLKERIREIFGPDVCDELIEINDGVGGIEIEGYIAKPKAARKSRTHQHLFLNGRPIIDRNIGYAIYQGYSGTLDENTHPVYCLFLNMDTNLVDVNIHPTKMQVRFANDPTIFYLFLNSVKKALNDQGVLADFSGIAQGSAIQKVMMDPQISADENRPPLLLNTKEIHSLHKKGKLKRSSQQMSLAYFKSDYETKSGQESLEKQSTFIDESNLQKPDVQFWQLHNKYIFSEIKSGVVIIDQHLAHARILFEKTLKIFENKQDANGQKLLFPQKITLALDDFMVFKDIYQVLNKIGFTINVFSGNTIIIEEMPADVKIGRESQILMDIIDFYKNIPQGDFKYHEKIAAGYAYKNAIKSGEVLNSFQMHNLVDQLFACEYPFYSPNGKPVITSMNLDELAARFKS